MDEMIKRMVQLTQQMVKELPTLESYEKLEVFLEQREQVMNEWRQVTLTSTDKKKYQKDMEELLMADRLIAAKIEDFKNEAANELTKLKAGRKQKNAYDAAYAGESLFYDTKK